MTASAMTEAPAGRAGSIDAPFWAGLAAGELRLQRCAACREWTWPPQWRCGACGSWEMDWETVPMTGWVHTFARTWHPFTPEMQGRTPFVTLLVDLPQAGGARLIGQLVGPEVGLAIGAAVEGVIEPPDRANPLAALRWKLAAAAPAGAGR